MAENPALHLVVSGGTIPGHDEESFGRFRRRIDAAVAACCAGRGQGAGDAACARSRVHLLGWRASHELPVLYAAADAGLNIEKPLYERRLGGENRVAQWQANGLPCVTTALSESGAELVRRGLGWQVPIADPAALAAKIRELVASASMVAASGQRAREVAARELGFELTAAALTRWCLAPERAGDHGAERLVRLGLLSRPEASTELLEAYVKELPLWQLLRRGLRWTLRRGLGAASAAARASFRSNGRRW